MGDELWVMGDDGVMVVWMTAGTMVVRVKKRVLIMFLWGGPTAAGRYFDSQNSQKATKRTVQLNSAGVRFFQYATIVVSLSTHACSQLMPRRPVVYQC